MDQKNGKGHKGFAIVNICVGVILAIAGFVMFSDPSVGPYAIISVALGIVIWVIGALALNAFRKYPGDDSKLKSLSLVNTICFVVSCVILAACISLPIIGPML